MHAHFQMEEELKARGFKDFNIIPQIDKEPWHLYRIRKDNLVEFREIPKEMFHDVDAIIEKFGAWLSDRKPRQCMLISK